MPTCNNAFNFCLGPIKYFRIDFSFFNMFVRNFSQSPFEKHLQSLLLPKAGRCCLSVLILKQSPLVQGFSQISGPRKQKSRVFLWEKIQSFPLGSICLNVSRLHFYKCSDSSFPYGGINRWWFKSRYL